MKSKLWTWRWDSTQGWRWRHNTSPATNLHVLWLHFVTHRFLQPCFAFFLLFSWPIFAVVALVMRFATQFSCKNYANNIVFFRASAIDSMQWQNLKQKKVIVILTESATSIRSWQNHFESHVDEMRFCCIDANNGSIHLLTSAFESYKVFRCILDAVVTCDYFQKQKNKTKISPSGRKWTSTRKIVEAENQQTVTSKCVECAFFFCTLCSYFLIILQLQKQFNFTACDFFFYGFIVKNFLPFSLSFCLSLCAPLFFRLFDFVVAQTKKRFKVPMSIDKFSNENWILNTFSYRSNGISASQEIRHGTMRNCQANKSKKMWPFRSLD